MVKMNIKIETKLIGGDEPAFIVAELSANHNQNFDIAVKTIKAAKEAGADAIKIQTYTPDTMTIDSNKDYFKIEGGTIWDGTTLYKLYQKAYTPWDWQPKLQKIAEQEGLIFFSTPFDKTSVDFLEEMNVPAYKIASFEITDIPLIKYIALKNKPIIISTGIAKHEDIKLALNTCKEANNENVILLKCSSAYPAPLDQINLKTIQDMGKRYGKIIGLSDHSLGIAVPVTSIGLGAKLIEKHFIIDKKIGGPDASFSLEPHEFKKMVEAIREAEKALGTVNYELTEKMESFKRYCRSLFLVKNIKKGDEFTERNMRSIRPGFGLHPKYFTQILGKKAKQNIARGTPLSWDHVEKNDK